jgi:hypothetical protein
MNQVTEAINKGLLAPSVNPSEAAVISVDSFSAATVYLYTRTTTAVAPAAIAQDLTYDYSQAGFTTSPPFGSANWETSPPGTVNGDYLWVTTVNISANVAQEIIPFASWSTPTVFSVNGQSSIVVNAFKRATSSPSTPTGGSYSFTTQTLTPPSGWSVSIPSGTNPVYISTAIATVSGTSGVDSSLTWSAAVKMVENGTDGDAGPELESGLVYYTTAQASNPGTPSATNYNFTTGAFTGLTTGWQTNPVTVNITTTTGLYWSSKFRINQGPNDANPTIVFNTPIPSVNFGTNIQSDNYIAGSSGWQIQRASGDAEFNNITSRGALQSSNFDGNFNSLSEIISSYSSSTGTFGANTWGLRDGFKNAAANITAATWSDYLDPVSNTEHVVLKIRAAFPNDTKIISQLSRGQQLKISRNGTNYAFFEVWQAGYLPEDSNTAYVQVRSIIGTPVGNPSSQLITLEASDVVDPGTEGYSFDKDKSVINSGTLDVANIRINGSIQAKNLDIGVTLQSKSGSRVGVSTSWLEFLRIKTADNPDFNTDITYNMINTVTSRSGVNDVVLCKVLDESQLGTEGTAIYSSSQISNTIGSSTSFALTVDRASIQANSPNQSSSFTGAMADANVNVDRSTIYLFCYRERPGGDTAIGANASGNVTEIRRP